MSKTLPHASDAIVEVTPTGRAENYTEPRPNDPVFGKWFWVNSQEEDEKTGKMEPAKRLACITHIGTNFVELQGPTNSKYENTGNATWRIHVKDFDTTCTVEPEHERIIRERIGERQKNIAVLMAKVQELTERLSLSMGKNSLSAGEETAALATSGNSKDALAKYKAALKRAEKDQLPKLFERIKEENIRLARWLTTELIPLEAQAKEMKPVIESVKDRIFNVELYSGLIERTVEIRAGEPAPMGTPITLFQRMHYMDEECLVNYRAGGMHFSHVKDFNKWLAKPENFERILPAPRCIVAFRVRHEDRKWNGLGSHINFWHEVEAERQTYLVIRNGEQLSLLEINRKGFDFDEQLFPDLDAQKLVQEQLYANVDSRGHVEEIITQGEYEARVHAHEEAEAYNATPGRVWHDRKHSSFWLDRWHPFNKTSVYFDEMTEHINDLVKKHNRIVLVLQGLLDRSLALHPHPVWQLWTPAGFAAALRLVYDDSRTLVPGPKPDFDAYRARLTKTIGVGSITVGQHAYWYALETERQANDGRRSRRSDHNYVDTYGNPGPQDLARVEAIRVKRKGGGRLFKFSWERDKSWQTIQRERNRYYHAGEVKETYTCSIWVPESKLFNVTAYTPGDFKIFFSDPRTRAEYVKWAPYLLTSEDWHAGKVKLKQMGSVESDDDDE